MNILITNIGRRNYLVEYIQAISNFSGKIYVSDCSDTAAGLYGSNDGYFLLPKPIDNPDKYVKELLALCKSKDIKLIIPVIDPEIFILSRYKDVFANENITIMVSDLKVLDICYNKLQMNLFLQSIGYDIPKTYREEAAFFDDLNKGLIKYPVIIKPIYGSGSKNTNIVHSDNQVRMFFNNEMIIQELICGDEYGIDVLNNMQGLPVRCVVKKKLGMRSGETDKAIIVVNEELSQYAVNMAIKLGHIGNLDSDIIISNGKKYFIDLNPRFGGGYPATHASGENYLKLLLDMASGKEIKPKFNDYEENILVMKTIKVVTHNL